MKITVRLFATLRQQAGWKEKAVEVAEAATVADLMAHLTSTEPRLTLQGRILYAAVNMEYAQPDRVLSDGDEVAFFPPVSGGVDNGVSNMTVSKKTYEITEHPLSLDEVAARISRP